MQTPGGAEVSRRALLALAAGVLALDQATKVAVVERLAVGESVSVFGDVLRITHVRNPGAAFGILTGFGGILALAAVIGVVVFLVIIAQHPPRWTGIGAALIAGGASGNLTDRLARGPFGRGTVVDYLDPSFWPAFNVADSAIAVGAILLVMGGFLYGEGQEKKVAGRRSHPPASSGDDHEPDRS